MGEKKREESNIEGDLSPLAHVFFSFLVLRSDQLEQLLPGLPCSTLYPSLRGPGEFLRLPGGWVGTKSVDSVPSHPAPIQGKDSSGPQASMSGVHLRFPQLLLRPEGPQFHSGPKPPTPPPLALFFRPGAEASSLTYLGRATSRPTRRWPVQSVRW